MFTRDEDFLAEAHRRQSAGIEFASVVYAHQVYVGIGRCIQDLEIVAKVFDAADMFNWAEYLPL